jgi:hypothetical protein
MCRRPANGRRRTERPFQGPMRQGRLTRSLLVATVECPIALGGKTWAGAARMAEAPDLGHPAPVRVLPAQVSGGVNVREKFGESFVVGRSSPTLRSHTCGAGLAGRRAAQPAVRAVSDGRGAQPEGVRRPCIELVLAHPHLVMPGVLRNLMQPTPKRHRLPLEAIESSVEIYRPGHCIGIGVCWCSNSRQRPARFTYTLVKRPANSGWPSRCAVTR